MKILVNGGAGYIGSVLVPELLKADYDVRVVDTFWFGDSLPSDVEKINSDIRNYSDSWLKGVDAIIHLAAFSNDPMAEASPMSNYVVNAACTAHLAQKAKEKGIHKFIMASSASVYGYILHKLLEESYIPSPKFPYAISKLMAERALMSLEEDNFEPVILRKGTVGGYSPRMRFDLVVNLMTANALSKGKIVVNNPAYWRPIVDIRDVARAYILALKPDIHGVFNISENNYMVKGIALEIAHALILLGKPQTEIEINNKTDLRSYQASTERAKEVLKFEAQHNITDTVTDLVHHIDNGDIGDFFASKYHNIKFCKEHQLLL